MVRAKVFSIVLDDYGDYLGMTKGCFHVKRRNGKTEKYPLIENDIGEVILKSGSLVSVGALASLGFFEVDVLVMTRNNKPIAVLKPLNYDSHVKTRIMQYEAYRDVERRVKIAKTIIKAKFEGQNQVLEKLNLKPHDDLDKIEGLDSLTNVMHFEAMHSKAYFQRLFSLLPKKIKPKSRQTYNAYDGVNNLFNLAYEVLSWKVYQAVIKAKLEPYLGFMHSVQPQKPSFVCDFMEIYRYLIDYFVIEYCIKNKDLMFTLNYQNKGSRLFLGKAETKKFVKALHEFLHQHVRIERFRHGLRQQIETLISEEAFLFAQYIRNEKSAWQPRIVNLNTFTINPFLLKPLTTQQP
ncbi:MAG: CRISPR-associated endonuclease Cas1 [Candidatus Bathyarchaeota archaeon]|jgi:CRISPR-associated protein Cas1|nr:CRISPR-associated endonuclease Cas1 [Candidatus Bathyarchaeota archaeon A05DMB-5]MDH7557607.1 CRISPR-associated endonuclease Cas1 [Candidatus Bathyarchaeota archaeon]